MQLRKPPLPALTVKLSKYNVDDVALGVCKTGAEEAGVTEVRTSLSEKKFEFCREIKVLYFFFFLMIRRPPRSTLFPYNDALPIFPTDQRHPVAEVRFAIWILLSVSARLA